MELTWINQLGKSVPLFTFNRTAYGIEIKLLLLLLVLCLSFNRTAYGIEILTSATSHYRQFFLLIAPLMELKLRNIESFLSRSKTFNRTAYGIEIISRF